MHDIWYADVSWPDTQKILLDTYPSSIRKPAILIHSWDFAANWHHFPPRTLTKSSYRFNTTDFTFSQYHPQTLKMKSYQKPSPLLHHVGMVVRTISMLLHKAGSPYNPNIHFPIYTTLVTHVEGVALNTSVHQYCVISIAPPTGHRSQLYINQSDFIYITLFIPITCSTKCFTQ